MKKVLLSCLLFLFATTASEVFAFEMTEMQLWFSEDTKAHQTNIYTLDVVSYNPFTKHPEPQHFWQHWDYMGEGPKPVPYKEFVQPLYYRTGGMK